MLESGHLPATICIFDNTSYMSTVCLVSEAFHNALYQASAIHHGHRLEATEVAPDTDVFHMRWGEIVSITSRDLSHTILYVST